MTETRRASREKCGIFRKSTSPRIAENMGALGIRVTKPGELRSALDRAISSGRPAVVDVQSDIEALAPNA